MKLGTVVIAGCMLLAAKPGAAQSGTAAAPVSGTWTGSMSQDESNHTPLIVKLKQDAKGGLTGTVTGPPLPGVIKTGTFDAKTGALKFQVLVEGQGSVGFAGTVAKNVASGQVSFGGQTGTFKITKGDTDAAPPAPAPAPSGNDAAAAARRSFTEVSEWVSKAAELVPADKYSYRPAATVRTFGQLIGHVTDSYNYYCARAAGRNVQWGDPAEKGATDKATLAPKLKQALEGCNAAYTGAGQIGALTDNVAHTSLHYGNIITYMRMMGLVPPSS